MPKKEKPTKKESKGKVDISRSHGRFHPEGYIAPEDRIPEKIKRPSASSTPSTPSTPPPKKKDDAS